MKVNYIVLYLFLLTLICCNTSKIKTAKKDAVQYIIVNNSTDQVWVYFKHSFPPENHKENLILINTNSTGICSQFEDTYTFNYLTQFQCGDYADSLLIYKVNTPDTLKTNVIRDKLWKSSQLTTENFNVTSCTYTITDQDF